MLSLKKGKRIAKFKGGDLNNKFLYFRDDIEKMEEERKDKKVEIKDVYSFLGPEFFEKFRPLKKEEEKILKKSFKSGELLLPSKMDKESKAILTTGFDRAQLEMKKRNSTKEIQLLKGEVVPIPRKEHQMILVGGLSGSGKSTWVSHYVQRYLKMKPDAKVWLFSKVDEDPALDVIEGLMRVKCDESLLPDEESEEEPLSSESFGEDSIVIFDDTEALADPKVDKAVHRLRDDLVNTGRQYGIIVISAVHSLLNHKRTREILQENTHLVYFPMGGCKNQIEGFMKRYVGLKGDTITKLLKIPSRWCMLRIAYPMCVLYETGVMMITE